MTQNRSTAVMQRRAEAHDSLDDFPTPPWATRALCEWLGPDALKRLDVWEPACNRGYMAAPLGEFFYAVWASDVHDYGLPGAFHHDFLQPFLPHVIEWSGAAPSWIISNPPFRLAEQFIERARQITPRVAMLVRGAFLEGVGRYERLFSQAPPSDVLQFCERVPMVKGRYDSKASTATSYVWLVWRHGADPGTRLHWIPPCRKRLERPSDATA